MCAVFVHVCTTCGLPTLFTYLQLQCVRRTEETEWETDVILPSVSFASLMLPLKKNIEKTEALELRM